MKIQKKWSIKFHCETHFKALWFTWDLWKPSMLQSLQPSLVLMSIVSDTQLELLPGALTGQSSLFNPNYWLQLPHKAAFPGRITSPGKSLKFNTRASTSVKAKKKKKKRKSCGEPLLWAKYSSLFPQSSCLYTWSGCCSCQTTNWLYKQCNLKENCVVFVWGCVFKMNFI